jgi:hypothetical protein
MILQAVPPPGLAADRSMQPGCCMYQAQATHLLTSGGSLACRRCATAAMGGSPCAVERLAAGRCCCAQNEGAVLQL